MSPTLYTVLSNSMSSTSLDGENRTQTKITDKLLLLQLTTGANIVPLLPNSPESVKKRSDVFYLQPHQNVHTHRSDSLSITCTEALL